MLPIGNIKLDPPLVLAPMAGISDLPYRLLNRSFGCKLAFTEMLSATALAYKSANTIKRLAANADDRPLGVQIVGRDPEIIKRALDTLSEYDFDVLDLNAACPVKKVASKGKGAGLLKEPEKLHNALKTIVENVNVPVTVKIRSGWDDTSVNAVDIALRAQDAGVKALTIHGRTREQRYKGHVDYRIIQEVKKAVEIPVIASGDAMGPELIKKLFNETGCDGVAVARGALGNPWIFRETERYLENGTKVPRPDVSEIVQTMKNHLVSNVEYNGEKIGVIHFRKFFSWYTRGLISVRELKVKAFLAATCDEMLRIIDELEKCASAQARKSASKLTA
jgi:tRNA-dihydrouridine synthase B